MQGVMISLTVAIEAAAPATGHSAQILIRQASLIIERSRSRAPGFIRRVARSVRNPAVKE
jgi:hypothetical protein